MCLSSRWRRSPRRYLMARSSPAPTAPARVTTSPTRAARRRCASRCYTIRETVREAILSLNEQAWKPALNQDGEQREGAWVAELTSNVDLSTWPAATRLICRRAHWRHYTTGAVFANPARERINVPGTGGACGFASIHTAGAAVIASRALRETTTTGHRLEVPAERSATRMVAGRERARGAADGRRGGRAAAHPALDGERLSPSRGAAEHQARQAPAVRAIRRRRGDRAATTGPCPATLRQVGERPMTGHAITREPEAVTCPLKPSPPTLPVSSRRGCCGLA